jgi:glycerophosphoryl diester phosphodiesterase
MTIFGHRGSAYAPENTGPAIRKAAELGINWVEVDVMGAADGLILCHDDNIGNITDSSGLVMEMTIDELKKVMVTHHTNRNLSDKKSPVLTLEEAIDIFNDTGLNVNLEIKPCKGDEKRTANMLMECLANDPIEGEVLISSFEDECLAIAMDRRPDIPRSVLQHFRDDDGRQETDLAARVDRFDPFSVNINHELLAEGYDFTAKVFDTGRPVYAYTVNEVGRARQLQGMGIEGSFSDYPDKIQKGLGL